ncbi:MAG TPA: glycosyltransferase [Candidatus Methylomirabilis sp.]|nr:glycosyltransferase [Candidatus Methylomirabilis sp.]
MKFSVIIPAYNEAAHIAQAVKALAAQTIRRSDFEIIVVDNNSTDDSAAIARQAGADLVTAEKKQGTNMARQKGLDSAQGEIVAFLDGDSIPPNNWLKIIETSLADKKVAAVSGPYDFGFTGFRKIGVWIYNNLICPFSPRLLSFIFRRRAGIIFGGNFAARKTALQAIGGLPQLPFWGDDAAIAMLISRRVGKVLFNPRLIIKSSPRRLEKSGFWKVTGKYLLAYLKIYFDKKYF